VDGKTERGDIMQRARSSSLLASIFLLMAMAAPASAATLDRIREAGVLRLGYVDGAAPFSYRDPAGKPAGYAVALCQKVAEAVKADLKLAELKTEFVQLRPDERFEAVKDGKVDLLCAAGAPTVQRRQLASFSIPVFLGGIGALTRKDAPADMRAILEGEPEPYRPRWRASLGQILRGRTFSAVKATTADLWLTEKLGEFAIDAKAEPVDSFAQGVERVVDGRVDALFGPRELLLDAAQRSPSADDLMLIERHFTYEAVALALERGDEDFRLLVDRALSALYSSHDILQIYTPYFGKPDEQELRLFRLSALVD
jgi:polar amino acid transport system substrate-binding protein